MLSRRSFLIGASSLLAAPAIVKASSLMPVRVWDTDDILFYRADGSRVYNEIKVRSHAFGGYGMTVPKDPTAILAIHRETGNKLHFKSFVDTTIGWIPKTEEMSKLFENSRRIPDASWVKIG